MQLSCCVQLLVPFCLALTVLNLGLCLVPILRIVRTILSSAPLPTSLGTLRRRSASARKRHGASLRLFRNFFWTYPKDSTCFYDQGIDLPLHSTRSQRVGSKM